MNGWTLAEACAEFERAGRPVDPYRFRLALRAFQISPVARPAAGPQGGRGHPLYDIAQLQQLHAVFFAPWLTTTGERS